MQMQASPVLSLSPSSPSFNAYSSGRLAEIAARVVEEFRQESDFQDDIYETWPEQNRHHQQLQREDVIEEEGEEEDINGDDDGEFEFAFVSREPETSTISADEIFYNGQIRPIYPLFNTNLLNDGIDKPPPDCRKIVDSVTSSDSCKPRPRRLPLRKLMSEERVTTTSCSPSEADELDGLTPGTYCVWKPKNGSCKKSNSTGSSKRWKLRDILYRSHSDGKATFVFLAPTKKDKAGNNKVTEINSGKFKEAEQEHCNRDMKTGDKRRSYLPYRQDLVGIFSNVNGFNRNLHAF